MIQLKTERSKMDEKQLLEKFAKALGVESTLEKIENKKTKNYK